jgi:putative N-acetyltransferase (TIGR04045 family)
MSHAAELSYEIADREPLLFAYFALRRQIFCEEQALFSGDDRDAWDDVSVPIVCVARHVGGAERVVGVVRIYEEMPGIWFGGRLGVEASHRGVGSIGRSLVYKAVTTAHARDCQRFFALVQPQNVAFFRRMHWWAIREMEAHGHPHMLMEADLSHYPAALASSAVGNGRAPHDDAA